MSSLPLLYAEIIFFILATTAVSFRSTSFLSKGGTTIAFTTIPKRIDHHRQRRITCALEESSSSGDTSTAEDDQGTQHITDANHESILFNPQNLPVLIDCYTSNCGPCKLIEKSLTKILPKYTTNINPEEGYAERLIFCKWDANTKDESESFMNIMREYDYTFRKLPTLQLFYEGIPIAMRSGMATDVQIERFLEENLPKPWESLFVPTTLRRNAGGV